MFEPVIQTKQVASISIYKEEEEEKNQYCILQEQLPSTSIRQPELTKLMASDWSISFCEA